MKRIISVGRGTSDRSSLIHSSLVRSWSVLWTGGSGLSRLTCQAPDGSPGAAIVQDQLHLLPQNPDWENRSTAGEGSPLPRAVASDYGDGVILGAAVVASTWPYPSKGRGCLSSSSVVLVSQRTPLLCCVMDWRPRWTEAVGPTGRFLSPSPPWWKCINFSSDLASCYACERKKEREKKEREKGISLFMSSRLVSFTDSCEILEGKG